MSDDDEKPASDTKKHRGLTVTVDLPGVLILLLVASFVLMALTIGYGLVTDQLKPATVLTVVGTVFSGVLAGALATSRNSNKTHTPPKPPQEDEDK